MKILYRLQRITKTDNSSTGTVGNGFPSKNQSLHDAFLGINHIFDIYLAGKKPRYPGIDGASFTHTDKEYLEKVKQAVQYIMQRKGIEALFYGLPMLTALKLLDLNGRDEAVRYEPLNEINRAAFKQVRSTNWEQYKFSAILVPGLGPQNSGIPLDPGGARRCDMAAAQFKKGEAPFIIVSGGHVHPNKTPYSEAIEMKNYLVNRLKIPEEAVIAEPYARHTTTNIRNAARLVFAMNMPAEKPVLIVTDFFQSTYIPMMKSRFLEELGYLPYQEISKVKSVGVSFIPDISALQINPLDPLDP
ncbi:MAG: YdcF family protein [Chitinophagaceae bacterium]|nr:MAG: YdcF family protein [Chitinophagaceae bacterium]